MSGLDKQRSGPEVLGLEQISISVVVPVYNSEECVAQLVRRLKQALDPMGRRYEIVLVNDCSPDRSWDVIVQLCDECPEIKALNLRRNFGQQGALMAGLNNASGRYIVTMDDDLQHDPADIPKLLAKLDEGYDVCYAKFDTKKQTLFKNFGSWLNDKAANIVLKKPKEVYLSSFKAMKREIAEEIIKYDGPWPYVDGLIFRVTRSITQITVKHHHRLAGRGNYNLPKLISVWARLATNFSVFPLRLAAFFGFVTAGLGFLSAMFLFINYLFHKTPVQGWPSLIVTILFLGGVQLLALGVIGEYVGRLFLHHSSQPQFVIRDIRRSLMAKQANANSGDCKSPTHGREDVAGGGRCV